VRRRLWLTRPAGSACEELTDGYYNAAYALQFWRRLALRGQDCAARTVRVLRYEHDIMAAEVKALRLVRQHTEMPVPEVICYDRSRRLLPQEWFLMPYLPGAPLHRVRDQLAPGRPQMRIDRRERPAAAPDQQHPRPGIRLSGATRTPRNSRGARRSST
jgi:aminoglycoside phosphotransferase (APT) family kinase protein